MLKEKRDQRAPSTQGPVDEDQAMRWGAIKCASSFPGLCSILIHVRSVKHLPVGRNGIGHSIRIDCGEARGKYADIIQICTVDALNSLGSLPTQTKLRRYRELSFRREVCMLMLLCVRIIPRLCGIKRTLEVLCETIISHDNFKSHGGIGAFFFFDQAALFLERRWEHSPIT